MSGSTNSLDVPAATPARAAERPRHLRRVGIRGTGSCVPERILTNADLERMVDTSDDWIVARTGMRERRVVQPGEATSDLATQAARVALSRAGVPARDVALIIVATVTPDNICPPTACHVQRKIGAPNAAGFDLSAACSGYVNALMTGHLLVASGSYENALVIGADALSAITDYQDRESCILFGDGAGAVFLSPDADGGELLDHVVHIDGTGHDLIMVEAGGSRKPASLATVTAREHFLSLRGREVFKFAVKKFSEVVLEIVQRNDLTVHDLDLIVPHQANLRILEAAAKKLDIGLDRLVVNIDRYGNTSSASIPLALDEAVRTGRMQRGDLVCSVAFGGGLSWGASLMRW